ncbi:MAG: hypothetical protein HOM68_20800 [Gemmatimonadetes bacterium]|jgi:hypothetical protein|nr:hypothetical protein [Gemmatimonadota bacterium]MBT4609204.1 hypothetical protein [Gemmatimonadota bacterium]MBT5058995.1 hypothetical protein [Gemmatimonadota bacterium]MBT5142880.1 hypothetical protein [Gemmatimonadota bacterium]MBT5589473.1 hypothetical protein [Gemmatimonadota bacterium]
MSPRIIDLENADHRDLLNAEWRYADGLVPGEPNGGLVNELAETPARLADYDDSNWDIIDDIQLGRSTGFCFGWYRMTVTLPETIDGELLAGRSVFFETCVDDYGELWIDSECDMAFGETGRGCVSGFNYPQRVCLAEQAEPGREHVIAVLAVNGPFGRPGGGIFLRYARLTVE